MKKIIVTCMLAIAVPLVAVCILWNADSHRLGVKYNLWKLGILELPPDSSLRFVFLNVDLDFRESMVGVSMESVKGYYPDMKKFGNGDAYQTGYEKDVDDKENWYWLGKTAWAVKVVDNKVIKFSLFKG